MSHISRSPPTTNPARFKVTLAWQGQTCAINAIIDSGADGNFIDTHLAQSAALPLVTLNTPLAVTALDGHSLGPLTHRTSPLPMTISGNHTEEIQFYVLKTPLAPLILGRPWLELHIPQISYGEGRILSWSTPCYARCLCAALTPSSRPRPPLTPPDLTLVPEVYHDLGEAFNKERARTLPPHDRMIALLSSAPTPSCLSVDCTAWLPRRGSPWTLMLMSAWLRVSSVLLTPRLQQDSFS